jgi:hypothetical protein
MASRIIEILTSRKTALVLFGCICLFSIPGTVAEQRTLYGTPLFRFLLALLGLNVLICTVSRAKSLPVPVMLIHAGVLITLAGGMISSFGFIGTVNIYEGESTGRIYRWDKGEDIPLGADLRVLKINLLYYPVPVKVGVLKGREKSGLFTIKTGESFSLDSFVIKADAIELPAEKLTLSVYAGGFPVGTADTGGRRDLPENFPYSFVLVAYQNPVLSRTWVDLTLSRGNTVLAEGKSEVNEPFQWNGLSFYHTRNDFDAYGRPYAGIQIVRDRGRGVVFFGFVVMLLGSFLWMYRKLAFPARLFQARGPNLS